jgi:hypothetical protein
MSAGNTAWAFSTTETLGICSIAGEIELATTLARKQNALGQKAAAEDEVASFGLLLVIIIVWSMVENQLFMVTHIPSAPDSRLGIAWTWREE